jgi:sugar lactone lactonase YvrE
MIVAVLFSSSSSAQSIFTIAGGSVGDDKPATAAALNSPSGVAVDSSGNLYVADSGNHRIRRVDGANGIITTVAGSGAAGFSGDGSLATEASLNFPLGVALDGSGNLYFTDSENHRIRRVDAATGVITTVAGTGEEGFSGDGSLATAATLNVPYGVVLDGSGNLFFADSDNHRIRRIDAATGIITTIAGSDTQDFFGDGGPAVAASLNAPYGVALDSSGNLYIADRRNFRIRKVTAATGTISTVAGNGARGFSGDGGPADAASLQFADGVALDSSGNLYIADGSNSRIRRVAAGTGVITTVAGDGTFGLSGDGGPASAASLNVPTAVALDGSGDIYIADNFNDRIRKVAAATGIITTVAGSDSSGDGAPATAATLNGPVDVALDGAGNLYIADGNNHRIRKVTAATGIITTIAGNGAAGFSGDGGPATEASLFSPSGLSLDGSGNLYIADRRNHRIRKVTVATGTITTVAGTGTPGPAGDGGAATAASLTFPVDVALDGSGNLYIADRSNARIRKVIAATGIIATVAGIGTPGFSGDGGPATAASLNSPTGVALDGSGDLFIADSSNNRIRKVAGSTGIITTVAGNGTRGFSGDGGPSTAASLNDPDYVALDETGNLYIADTGNNRIRKVSAATGTITTVAGNGVEGFSGDRGPATEASLGLPGGLAVDGSGSLYFADTNNQRIRVVSSAPTRRRAVRRGH